MFILIVGLKKRQKSATVKLSLNKPLLKLMGGAFIVLILGIISVYIANLSDIQKYEDKPLFPELSKQINEVENITIKTHDTTLSFIKKDGVWMLKEHPDFAVFQERIKSFLSALLEARFYEKKSDKAENLALFGLQPIESENSPNTRIELLSSGGQNILSFEVGKYNLDLGRGSNAAYVKFDGKFQVWLVEADFVDLSPDWQQWTYSRIWDLRFGRLKSINNDTNPDMIAEVMKHLLNTPFTSSVTELENPELIKELALKTEDDNEIVLKFYESNSKVWMQYDFKQPLAGKHLQFFAPYVKDRFLEIDTKNWEAINNASKGK